MKRCDRSDDDRCLRVLRGLADGQHIGDIAAREGLAMSYVSVLRQRVLAADIKESGEDGSTVWASYQPAAQPKRRGRHEAVSVHSAMVAAEWHECPVAGEKPGSVEVEL